MIKMNKPVKIMRIISRLGWGGAELRMVALLERMNRERFHTQVVCIKDPGPVAPLLEKIGIKVHHLPVKSRWSPLGLYRLRALMRREKIDIAHTHMYAAGVSGTAAARLARVPVVISHFHNVDMWENPGQVKMEKRMEPYRDRILAVSEEVRQDYIRQTKVNPAKVQTVYNGVEVEKFDITIDREAKRKELGLNHQDKVVGMVSRLVPQKAPEDMLHIAKRVIEEFPQVKFMYVGGGDLFLQLERQAKDMGLADKIILLGKRQDVPQLLKIMDISLLTSLKEGFSNTILESMAAGLPVVATTVGGNAEAVVEGETGYLCAPGDIEGLSAVVLQLLKEPQRAKEMGEKGRQRVKTVFSLEKMVKDMEGLYEELVREKK